MSFISRIVKDTIENEIDLKIPSQDEVTFLRQYLLDQQRIYEQEKKTIEKRLSEERAEKLFWREKYMKTL